MRHMNKIQKTQKDHLIELIKKSTKTTSVDKERLIKEIAKMNDEEFLSFLDGMLQAVRSEDPEKTIKEASKRHKDAHEKFMRSSRRFLHEMHATHKNLQETEDSEDYADTLEKIKSL